jgi:hypothetical protein
MIAKMARRRRHDRRQRGLFDRVTFPVASASLDATLRALASVYADEPGFREEWR